MTAAEVAERRPHPSGADRPAAPAGRLRRGELAAGLAAVAVAAQLALAPVTLLIAGLLVLAGRLSRWRLAWLLLPAVGSLGWLAATGLPATLHALASGAGRLLAAEGAVAAHPERLLHPAAVFAGSGQWLTGGLPLLALAGTVEAAVALWRPGRPRPHPASWPGAGQFGAGQFGAGRPGARDWRPGLVAALRRRAALAALAAGHTVTASGCAIGLDYRSGRPAAISWAQAAAGVVLTGADPADLGEIGLAMACAALRRRKTVVVLDLAAAAAAGSAEAAGWAGKPRGLAGPAGRGTGVAARVARLAEGLGVPVTEIGGPPASTGSAGAVSFGTGSAGTGSAGTGSAGTGSGSAWSFGTGSIGAGSGSTVSGSTGSVLGAVGRALRSRGAVVVSAHQPEQAQRAVAELAGALASVRDLGLRGDCLAWISGCEPAGASQLSGLLALGRATGTALVLSATSPAVAAELADEAGLVVAAGRVTDELAQRLAGPSAPQSMTGAGFARPAIKDMLRAQRRGEATMIAGTGPVSFRIAPVAAPDHDPVRKSPPAANSPRDHD